MGLFDKIKTAAQNAVGDAQEGYQDAMAMNLHDLVDAMKDMGKLDPKIMVYRTVLREKCGVLSDEKLEDFYQEIKKQGTFLKQHPAQKAIEDVLVHRDLYIRNEDGTITKNSRISFFK